MNSHERGGDPDGEDLLRPVDSGQESPATAQPEISEQPVAGESQMESELAENAEHIAQLRQEIVVLNADVQGSEVMAKHGSVDENQSNRDKTYTWVESQVLAKENEIRKLEINQRRFAATPRIQQLKAEIDGLNRDVQASAVMAKYGSVEGNQSNRDQTYDWVESQVLAKEAEIRQLEDSFREPQPPVETADQAGIESEKPEIATAEMPTVPVVPTVEITERETTPLAQPAVPETPVHTMPRAEQAENAEVTPETEAQEKPSVADARMAFAKALHKRGNFVGKTSDEAMEQLGRAYLDAIDREQRHQFQAVREEFQGREMNEQTRAEHDARLVTIAASTRHEEENALSEALKEQNEQSRFGRIKQWWRKHPKHRLAGSLALMAVSGASLATGNLPVFAGAQALRTGLSGVSTGMAVESVAEMTRNRFGDTKKLSAEAIQKLEQGDLERHLAAQTIRSAELGQGTEANPLNATAQALRQEYERRNQAALVDQLRSELQAGTTMDEITEKFANTWLKDQGEFLKALESRRDGDRRFKTRKAVGSILAGLTAGFLVADHGVDKAHDLAADHAHKIASAKLGEFATAAPESTNPAIGLEATGGLQPAAEIGAVDIGAEMAKHNAVEVIHKGDTVWSLVKQQAHDRLGDQFDHIDPARQTYIIDAIKDKIAADPHAFGLENADQLQVGDKIDFSHLFQGPEAVHLDQIQADALHLDQGAVEHILKNNELLREWVTAHPHEALNGTMVEQVLSGHAPVAETGATIIQPELADPIHEKMVSSVTHSMTERMLCELQEKYPAEYAQAHADHPDLYPDRAGLLEQPEAATVHLSEVGAKALKRYGETITSLHQTASPEAADKIVHQVGELHVDQALKKGVIERMVDSMEGGTTKTAQTVERTTRSLLRSLPKGEYLNSEKVSEVLKRLPK